MAGKKKYYAVRKGRTPGLYTQWYGPEGAQVQVDHFPGAVYKGFARRNEALAFLQSPSADTPSRRSGSAARDPQPQTLKAASSASNHVPNEKPVLIYTDGGASGNPGPGGYGVVIISGSDRRELSGGFRRTTNNRMELLACIVGLEQLTSPAVVRLYSDSRYVVNGISKGWAERWRKNNWMRTKTDPALNADLWQRLLDLCQMHAVAFKWVKGHAGHCENERCDRLAVAAAHRSGLPPDEVYEADAG